MRKIQNEVQKQNILNNVQIEFDQEYLNKVHPITGKTLL